MSSDLAPGRVLLHGAGKCHREYARPRDRLLEWCSFGRIHRHKPHWALRDIDLDIAPGEAVGIVGRNGAGKSTLLKLVTGTTAATEGVAGAGGRIAALLELGLGFHPEFSGRQNALLAGQLLGASRSEMASAINWIVEFSELGETINRPLRTYSTGMVLRLAFATATAMRPDVLIVDEALAVGDAAFQHRCTQRIQELRRSGTTLLFVSHDANSVKSLCSRAVLLEDGRAVFQGTAVTVLDYYNARIAQRPAGTISVSTGAGVSSGDGTVTLRSVRLEPASEPGRALEIVESGAAVRLRVSFDVHQEMPFPTIGMVIRDRLGSDVYGINAEGRTDAPARVAAGTTIEAEFVFECRLGAGRFSCSVAAVEGESYVAASRSWNDHALLFEVTLPPGPIMVGIADLRSDVCVRVCDEQPN